MTANEAGTASGQDAPDHVFKLSYLPILKQVQVFTIADALVPANLERTLSLMDMQIHLVTGGALCSHLIDRAKGNIAHWIGHPRFELIRHDVTEPIKLRWTEFGIWPVLLRQFTSI